MELDTFEIIVGTYEEFLLGYKIQRETENYKLVQSFATHSHHASIRCVAAGGKYLASGGADETVQLYDLKLRKEVGVLSHHSGTVSSLTFSPNGSHLLSGSEDGTIAICRCGSWQVEKLWKGTHKDGGVVSLTCHPSGKIALSVGVDAILRTWNLVKGRLAYAKNLGGGKHGVGRAITCVSWSPDGDVYIVVIGSKVDIYSVETASVTYTINCDKKVSSVCFIENNVLSVGLDDGEVCIYNIQRQETLVKYKCHESRVKCLECISLSSSRYLASASSSGHITLWKYKSVKLEKICEIETGCRITCMVVIKQMDRIKNEKNSNVNGSVIPVDVHISPDSSMKVKSKNSETVKKRKSNTVISSNKMSKVIIEEHKPLKKTQRTSLNSTQEWIVEDM